MLLILINLQQRNQSLRNVLPALQNNNTSKKKLRLFFHRKKNEANLDLEIAGGETWEITVSIEVYI